jgi:hypothetical protein
VRGVQRDGDGALVGRQPAQHRVVGPLEVGGRELLAGGDVVGGDEAAEAGRIGDRALLDAIALKAGRLEQALAGDLVA